MNKMNLFESSEEHQNTANQRELLTRLVKYLKEHLAPNIAIYKGGLFLGEYTGQPRYTQDVDISIFDVKDYIDVQKQLRYFGEELVREGLINSFEFKEEVVEGRSGGAKYRDSTGRILLSIDVSLGADILDFHILDTTIAGELRLTTIEQVLADKMSVLYSRKRFRRSKDLFDIYTILKNCEVDMNKFISCLRKREVYPLPVDKAPFNESHYEQMEHAYNTLKIQDAFTEQVIEKPSFEEVVRVVGKFSAQFMEVEI